jgi:dTDP-4-dehydrorhamnose reductase
MNIFVFGKDGQLGKAFQAVFDESKLNKLKSIARMERSYLKDIIDEIVEEFIKEYEVQKGLID